MNLRTESLMSCQLNILVIKMDGPNRVSSKQHFVSLHTYTCTHFVMMINMMLISSKSYNDEEK